MITRCDWCKQPMAGWIPFLTSKVQANEIVLTKELYDELLQQTWNREVDEPHHPDCYKYGKYLMDMGWTPTRDYRDTPEIRKAMREQFQHEETP